MHTDALFELIREADVGKLRDGLSNKEVRLLLNTPSADGEFPIHAAVKGQNVKIVELLLSSGANPCSGSQEKGNHRGYTAAHYAASVGDVDMLRVLSYGRADLGQPCEDLWYPIHVATYKGHLPAMRFLVEQGVNINCENSHGQTPLVFAVSHGRVECVRYLLKNNASMTLNDVHGDTLLHHAFQYNLSKLFEGTYDVPEVQLDVGVLLVLYGEEVNKRNKDGHTGTHYMREEMPTIDKLFCLLSECAVPLRTSKTEWNYLTLLSAHVEHFIVAGIDTQKAVELVETLSVFDTERLAVKKRRTEERPAGGCPVMRRKPAAHKAEIPSDASDPSKGKCPFFRQEGNAKPGVHTTVSSESNLSKGKERHKGVPTDCVPSAENSEPGMGVCTSIVVDKPMCPLSWAFISRHHVTCLLMGMAFVLGMWVDQLLHRVLVAAR